MRKAVIPLLALILAPLGARAQTLGAGGSGIFGSGSVLNPSGPTTSTANGPVYYDDGVTYTSMNALLAAVPATVQNATIWDTNCGEAAWSSNPWSVIPALVLYLPPCNQPHTTSVQVWVNRGALHGGMAGNIAIGSNVSGSQIQPSTSFNTIIADPTSAPTLSTTTGSCSSYSGAPLYVTFVYLNNSSPAAWTRGSPEASVTAGTGNCATAQVASATNAASWAIFAGTTSNQETYQFSSAVFGSPVTIPSPITTTGEYAPGANATGAVVGIMTPNTLAGNYIQGARIDNLMVGCANGNQASFVPYANVGFYNASGQESSSFEHDEAVNCGFAYYIFEGFHGKLGAINSGPYIDLSGSKSYISTCGGVTGISGTTPCEPGAMTVGGSPPYGACGIIDDMAPMRGFIGMTLTPNRASSPTTRGLCIIGPDVQNIARGTPVSGDIHVEGTSGLVYDVESIGAHELISTVNGAGTTAVVHLDSNSTYSRLENILPNGSAPAIQDDVCAETTPGGQTIDSYDSGAKPTLTGFGTSPSIAKCKGGWRSFTINVGTGGSASTGTINFPVIAPNGWTVHCDDVTTKSTSVAATVETSYTSTTAVLTQYSDVKVATAWAASDILVCSADWF